MSLESPDTPETAGSAMNLDESVRAAVDGAATSVELGALDDALSDVRSTARQRRRRRNTLFGAAAAATLVVGGVVIANVAGDDGDGADLIVSAPVTDPVEDADKLEDGESVADDPAPDNDTTPVGDTDPSADPDVDPVPVESTPAPVVEVGTVAAATTEAIAADDSYVRGSYQQVLPWQDGFLALGQIQGEQALPAELSEEINAAFPPEVVQFFEDAGGLPPTISEATAMLQEAGLFDEVSDVVLNNPEVSEAIYSIPPAPPEQFARLSTDGVEWTDIDLEVPGDLFGNRQIFSTGDRLAVISLEYADNPQTNSPMVRALEAVAFVVHSTTDLRSWSTQRSEIESSTTERPSYVIENTYLNGVGVNSTGWVASVDTYVEVDYEQLLPADFDRSFMESQSGWGIYHDPTGLVIDTYDEQGNSDQQRVPWADIGLAGAPEGLDDGYSGGNQDSVMWAAAWDVQPTATVVDGFGFGQIYGFDDGFIRQGEAMSFSADGVSWTDFDRPVEEGWVNSFLQAPDGVIAFVQSGTGQNQPFRLDVETLTWSPLEQPVIPEGFSPWSSGASGAVLYSIEDFSHYDDMPVMEPFTVRIENPEYVLEAVIGGESSTFELIDIATGDVVVSETADGSQPGDFEYVVEVGDGLEILSPDTGEIVTVFTSEQMETSTNSSVDAAPSTDVPATTVLVDGDVEPGEIDELEYTQPSLNVLATNGEVWINQELDLGTPEQPDEQGFVDYGFAQDVVVNNGIVLVSLSNGSFIRLTF